MDKMDSPIIEDSMDIEETSHATSRKPVIAGVFLITAGILSLLTWISVFIFDFSTIDPTLFQQQGINITIQQIHMIMNICATLAIILSIFPIIGGIFAFKRGKWAITLLGGILGLFIIGPIFISSILSLIGLILVILSKEEFNT